MEGLIAFYLILFPLGKLTWFLPDIIVLTIALFNLRKTFINYFIIVCVFSLVFSLSIFKINDILTGFLYLIRFMSYAILSKVIYVKFGQSQKKRQLLFNCLILIGVFIAIFGWVQYFIYPDLRALKSLNWDDHYFRLVSSFLDPAFTGIILTLSEILLIIKTAQRKTFFKYFLNIFLIVTILLTYSRSSFLALFFALLFLLFKFKQRFIFIFLSLVLILIPILPKASSEGTNLTRTYSISQKFINYDESLKIISKSPLFGVGFNNICVATTKNYSSHSCSGLDNSILFIIATTGIIGIVAFTQMIFLIIKNTKLDNYGWGLMASLVAILIHGMFTETFFYNFILGWMAILIGITRKKLSFKD